MPGSYNLASGKTKTIFTIRRRYLGGKKGTVKERVGKKKTKKKLSELGKSDTWRFRTH